MLLGFKSLVFNFLYSLSNRVRGVNIGGVRGVTPTQSSTTCILSGKKPTKMLSNVGQNKIVKSGNFLKFPALSNYICKTKR